MKSTAYLRVLGWSLLCLTLSMHVVSASPISPKMPSTLNFQSLNEVSPPSTEADWTFEMSKLDMAICSSHISGLRARGSDMCLLKYMLLHYVIVTDTDQLTALQAYATANGYDMETAFLHYYDDTTATINGKSVVTPGYGGGTATSLSQARVKNFIWADHGWLYNPKSALFRKFIGHYYRIQMTTGYLPDGIFVDAVSPFRDYAPTTTTGGRIVEYGNRTKTDAGVGQEYQTDIAASFAEVNAAMGSDGKFGDRLLLPNIGWINEDEIIGFSADGILTEFWIQPVQPYFPYSYDLANRLAAAGKTLIYTQAAGGPQVPSQGNYSSAMDRHQMFALTNYWIARQGKYTYYQQKAPDGYPLLSSFWCKAREFDVGEPVDPLYSIWQTGTDSKGQNYTIYKRKYTKALMLNRPQIGWNYTDYSTLCAPYDLGGVYRLLHEDGTLGPEITQIGLAMGEAATLLKVSGDGPPSDVTAPTISGVASSSVTSNSASVSWTTNEPATGSVEYGTTTSYGSSASASSLTTSQSVALTGLAASTTYHYRVTATDSAGNKTIGTDSAFTTTASGGGTAGQGFIRHWAALGSFGYTGAGHNTDYIGEATIKPSVGNTTAGKTWTDLLSATDKVDLYWLYTPNEHAITYLNVYVHSPAQRDCQVRFAVDDAGKVFLNGVLVDDNTGYRSSDPDTDKVNVTLKAGWNQLLVKAENFTVGWTVYARITDAQGNVIPDLTYQVNYPAGVGAGTPNIDVSITVDKQTAKVGDQLVYTVIYTNTGDGPAASALVTANVDPHVAFVSATGGGAYDASTRMVRWSVGTIQPGASATVKYTAAVQ